MRVLAIDLSSAWGSVAVAHAGRIVSQTRFPCERGRGAGVFAALEAMRDAWRGADCVAVGVGPGSYNGLRASCAIAGSIQQATGARLCIAPSPCLVAVDDAHFAVYGDARGGRAFRAIVEGRSLGGEITLLGYAEAVATAKQDGCAAYRIGPLECLSALPETHPNASILALLAEHLPPVSPDEVRPIYLKPPHITPARVALT